MPSLCWRKNKRIQLFRAKRKDGAVDIKCVGYSQLPIKKKGIPKREKKVIKKMVERSEEQTSDRGKEKAESAPSTLTKHLLLPELALSLLFGLVQMKLTPLMTNGPKPPTSTFFNTL